MRHLKHSDTMSERIQDNERARHPVLGAPLGKASVITIEFVYVLWTLLAARSTFLKRAHTIQNTFVTDLDHLHVPTS